MSITTSLYLMNVSNIFDLRGSGGWNFSNRKLELVRTSFNTFSPFSFLIVSKIFPRTLAASPLSRRLPGSSPPSYINCPISFNETTFSMITLAKIRARNSGAFGASLTASSRVVRTNLNLARLNQKKI